MYMRETRQKRADGSIITYMQLAESVWNPAKKRSEVRIIFNCGRADDPETTERMRRLAKSILRRCSPEEIIAEDASWKLINAWPYGDLYVLDALWQRLGIAEIIERQADLRKYGFSVERALFVMVANRICAPSSKLYCYQQWLQEDVRIQNGSELSLHQLYRAMDFLDQNKDPIEKEMFFRMADLLNLDVDLVFYDTTSLHFEIDEEDAQVREAVDGTTDAEEQPALRKRGHSKNGRKDAPQLVVGLAVTRDGFPVRHWIFAGNTVDVTTIAKVKADLRGWRLSRCLFVGDAGMVSETNLRQLGGAGGKYILCMPMRRGDEVTNEVLSRPGRFRTVAENLRVKEVVVGDGERRRRYVVCHNPEEEKRQRLHREVVIKELEAELASMGELPKEGHTKRLCQLRSSGRYGRYIRSTRGGRPTINRSRIREEKGLDGKFVVHSNDDTLSPEDIALGYKQLQRVEQAWRTLKSGLALRPVFHWAPHRIRAHVALTVLGLLLERVAEHACNDTWRNIRNDLKQIKLAQLSSPNGTVWQVTDPTKNASNRLKLLEIKKPSPVVNMS